MAFRPRDREPLLARLGRPGGMGPARRSARFRRPEEVRPLRGRVAPRRTGSAVGAQGACRPSGLRVRDRRHDGHSEEPRGPQRLPHGLRAVQRQPAGRALPAGKQLADARAERPAPAPPRRRASCAVPWRHLLLRRSRSPLGDQADQEGVDGPPEGVPGARHRSGPDGAVRRPRHQVPLLHPEADRGACHAPRGRGIEHPGDRHYRHLRGRDGVHAAVEPFRARGTATR